MTPPCVLRTTDLSGPTRILIYAGTVGPACDAPLRRRAVRQHPPREPGAVADSIRPIPDSRICLPVLGGGARRARPGPGRGKAGRPRAPPLRMRDGRCLRLRTVRLRPTARRSDEANRSGTRRSPALHGPGRARDWDRKQGGRIPPPGPWPRHGRREPNPRIPRGSSGLQVRGVHVARPGGGVRAAHDEQPGKN